MNRGSPHRVAEEAARADRFNEAPIHESGKWSRRGTSASTTICFNEAPIHESGKCDCGRPAIRPKDAASMRPRFMNRGSLLIRQAKVRVAPLQ